jgi:hypothetical protein
MSNARIPARSHSAERAGERTPHFNILDVIENAPPSPLGSKRDVTVDKVPKVRFDALSPVLEDDVPVDIPVVQLPEEARFISRGVSPVNDPEFLQATTPMNPMRRVQSSPLLMPQMARRGSRSSVLIHRQGSPVRTVSLHKAGSVVSTSPEQVPALMSGSIEVAPMRELLDRVHSLHKRLESAEPRTINRRLKRAYDIQQLSQLSKQIVDNVLADVEVLPDRFRKYRMRNLHSKRTFSTISTISFAPGEDEEWEQRLDSMNGSLESLVPRPPDELRLRTAEFIELVNLMQGMLKTLGDMRCYANELSTGFVDALESKSHVFRPNEDVLEEEEEQVEIPQTSRLTSMFATTRPALWSHFQPPNETVPQVDDEDETKQDGAWITSRITSFFNLI